jgi:hypothetical protein
MKKGTLFFLFLYLVLASGPLLANQFVQLRVSATIPPRPCEYPNNCDPVPANTRTKVVVDNTKVSYVGSPPEVTKKDDLMTIIF